MNGKQSLCMMALTLLLGWQAVLAAEEDTVQAVIPWEAQGRLFMVDTDTAMFLGALQGILYVESSRGEINEAFVMCPVMQTLDLKSGQTEALARCEITASGEDVAYARLTCDGAADDCNGSFVLTSGVGAFAGISGEGKLRVRSPLSVLVPDAAAGADINISAGLAIIKDLSYRIP